MRAHRTAKSLRRWPRVAALAALTLAPAIGCQKDGATPAARKSRGSAVFPVELAAVE